MSNLVQRFEANEIGQDYVIGDLHGQLGLLLDAMAAVDFNKKTDRIFSVGDIIDRGEQSRECLELVRENWFFGVLGNHESMMIDFANTQEYSARALWLRNGGDNWTDAEFLETEAFFDLVRLAATLPLAIEILLCDGRKVGITHAEPACKNWREIEEKLEASWYRHKALWSDSVLSDGMWCGGTDGVDLTVHGHTMFVDAVRRDNACYIDTAAGMYDAPSDIRGKFTDPRLSFIQLEDLFDLPQLSTLRAQMALKKRQDAIAVFSQKPAEDS